MRWTKVRIGHIDFVVRWTTTGALGRVHVSRQYLRFRLRQKPQTLADTVWHEIWHAMEELTHLPDVKDEEARMQMISGLMVGLFRDNPEFIQDLLELSQGRVPLKSSDKTGKIACRRVISVTHPGRLSQPQPGKGKKS